MPTESASYFHGTTPEEQARLSLLNTLLNVGSLAQMAPAPGMRVLDVGSGLGQFTRAIAGVTGVPVVGIERSAEQIAEALRQAREAGEESLVELRQGSAEALPLHDDEWGRFDLAHARFVLEHVTDPIVVVRGMVRAVRPGGRIVLEDDDHELLRLWPEPPGAAHMWSTYMRAFERNRNDPFVGRRLVALLHEAGATPVRNTSLFFGTCAGDGRFPAFIENLLGVYRGARQGMIETGGVDGAAFDAGIAAIRVWARRPDAAIWYGRCWAEGARPG